MMAVIEKVVATQGSGTTETEKDLSLWSLNNIYIYFLALLGPRPWHMEVPRLGI